MENILIRFLIQNSTDCVGLHLHKKGPLTISVASSFSRCTHLEVNNLRHPAESERSVDAPRLSVCLCY